MTDDLARARLKRDRELLAKAERWTPQEALEAALSDIKLGELKDVQVITIVVACSGEWEGKPSTFLERYTGSNGVDGPKDTFWVIGMLTKAIKDWLS